MKRSFWYILTLLFVFASCERRIVYEGEITQPKLVLQAEVSEGDTDIKAYVSRSRFFTEEMNSYYQDYRMLTANVEIQRGEQEWLKMDSCTVRTKGNQRERFFTVHLDSPLQAGETIRIRASHPDYDTITAEQTIVHEPWCQIWEYNGQKNTLWRNKSMNYVELTLILQNYPFEDATLGVNVTCWLHTTYKSGSGSRTDHWRETVTYIRSYDRLFVNTDNTAAGQTSIGSRYELFAHPGYTNAYLVNLEIPYSDLSYKSNVEILDVTIDTMTVSFNAHSNDSYLYRRSMYKAQGDYNDSDFDLGAEMGEIFGQEEDVQIYSNVRNGYGIFAACSRYTIIKHNIKTVTQ